MQKFHNIELSPAMHRYISAVVDPLGASEPASIPDTMNDNSLCLRDNYESGGLTNIFDGTIQAVLFWIEYGYTTLGTNYASSDLGYSLNAIGLDANNYPVLMAANTYKQYTFINYPTICGSSSTVDPAAALIAALRLIAAGLRVLPLIEFVTDPTQIYLSYIIGGQPSCNDLYEAIDAGNVNIESLMRNTKGAQIYPNNEGCCVRYDPFQADHQADMKPLTQFLNVSNNWDAIKVPAVLCKFSNSVVASANLPLIINSQLWIEGILKQPTPIYSEESPSDPSYPIMKSIMSHPCDDHPFVTKGHTFKNFNLNSPAFLKTLGFALKASSYIPGLNYSGADKILRQAGSGFSRAGKRARKRNNRKRKPGSGVNKPTAIKKPVPNVVGKPQRPYYRRKRG
jgi:hypothetical protein